VITNAELQCVYLGIDGKVDDEGRLGVYIATKEERCFDRVFTKGVGGSICAYISVVQVDNKNYMVRVELTMNVKGCHFTFLFEKQRREKNENEDTYASIYYAPFGDET